jgi:hypothetical protein
LIFHAAGVEKYVEALTENVHPSGVRRPTRVR